MTKLYVIEEPDQFIGKTIACVEMNMFQSPLMLVTTDGGIMVWTTHCDEAGNLETFIYRKKMVEMYLHDDEYPRKRIMSSGLFNEEDINEIIAKQIEAWHKKMEILAKQREERDRQEYERLKKKFEEGNND